jgi:hypothetical protein
MYDVHGLLTLNRTITRRFSAKNFHQYYDIAQIPRETFERQNNFLHNLSFRNKQLRGIPASPQSDCGIQSTWIQPSHPRAMTSHSMYNPPKPKDSPVKRSQNSVVMTRMLRNCSERLPNAVLCVSRKPRLDESWAFTSTTMASTHTIQASEHPIKSVTVFKSSKAEVVRLLSLNLKVRPQFTFISIQSIDVFWAVALTERTE